MPPDPIHRFASRVEQYARYRPGYPQAILSFLESELGLSPTWRIADVGTGTGLFAELFLKRGYHVIGIEPNGAMLGEARRRLARFSGFYALNSRAEATALAGSSVDCITVAQAFHWFRRDVTRREFRRILRSSGWIVLVWNSRRTRTSPFLRAFEAFLRTHALDYHRVNHQNLTERVFRRFFSQYHMRLWENRQTLDRRGLHGRVLSSSYMPLPSHPRYAAMCAALDALFDRFQINGEVIIEYDTMVYWGRPK